jgi:hypothetical protein
MTLVKVKEHTRGKPDPFASIIEAKKPRFAVKWHVELVTTDDPRLKAPIPEPAHAPGRKPLLEIAGQLMALAKSIGRNQ